MIKLHNFKILYRACANKFVQSFISYFNLIVCLAVEYWINNKYWTSVCRMKQLKISLHI